MKVLIIGLGYAGQRFLNAFNQLNHERSNSPQDAVEIACVNRSPVNRAIPAYADTVTALKNFIPDIVVISVTDGEHYNILHQLEGYRGFVICEKPLVNRSDDLLRAGTSMQSTVGFGMDMVERYSEVTQALRNYIQEHDLTLARAHFIWGKDRINDHRRTSGAVSEIIHALDLIEHVMGDVTCLEFCSAVGAYSDFSVSGPSILDSLYIGARLNQAVVTGYSSFVNVVRQRTVDFVFNRPDGSNIYAHAVYDTPCWDSDQLTIRDPDRPEDMPLVEMVTDNGAQDMGTPMIAKLTRLVRAAIDYTENGIQPDIPFCDLDNSLRLQQLLNLIELEAISVGTYRIRGSRSPTTPNMRSAETLG